ncbi:MAG: hypothetical protein QXJ51_03105 [Sulfolobales archaeon]
MDKVRKNIAIDRKLAEDIKAIAKSRGMTLSEYLRKLLSSAIDLEKQGLYAPRILEEARDSMILSSFRFIYIPQDILSDKKFDEEDLKRAREYGERVGRVLKEMFLDIRSFIERFGGSSDLIISRGSSIIIIKSNGIRRVIAELIIGIARGGDLDVSETDQIAIINPSATGKS